MNPDGRVASAHRSGGFDRIFRAPLLLSALRISALEKETRMRKSVVCQAALVLLFGFVLGSSRAALASNTAQQSPSSTNTTPQITGTDPEPIDPTVVDLILALLGFA